MYRVGAFFCLLLTISHVKSEPEVELTGKVAVVTGAARGIGRAIADNLLQEKVRVVIIVDKNLPQGLKTESEFKSKYGAESVWFIHGDVTTDLDRAYKEISEKFGYVDILVNNAGILNEDDPVGTIITDTLAPALWSQKFYDVMRINNGGKGGTIINLASTVAYTKDPFFWFYKAAKFGVLGLSVGLGHEWNYITSKVRVIALCPNLTYTHMTKQQMVIDEQVEIFNKVRRATQWQTPDAVGVAAVTLLKSGKTGTAYSIQGGELSESPYGSNATVEYLLSLQ